MAIGSLLGGILGSFISEGVKEGILKILGIITLAISFKMVIEGDIVKGAATVLLGYIIGKSLRLSDFFERFENMGGVIAASVLFCTGPMTVLGSIKDAFGDPEILIIKALLDGFASITFASIYGYKIILSSLVVLTVQGGIGLASLFIGGGNPDLSVLNSAGGMILMAIGFNLMRFWKFEIANLLMAFPIIPLWYFLRF
ncbi:MAG: DUF554 family protein [candidate division WOR-3 bacterium]